MYRIEFLCEDQKVGPIKRMLASQRVLDLRDVPLVGAERGTNGHAKGTGNGKLTGVVYAGIKKAKLKTVRSADIKRILTKAGLSKFSYSYAITALMADGKLKRISTGKYEVK